MHKFALTKIHFLSQIRLGANSVVASKLKISHLIPVLQTTRNVLLSFNLMGQDAVRVVEFQNSSKPNQKAIPNARLHAMPIKLLMGKHALIFVL